MKKINIKYRRRAIRISVVIITKNRSLKLLECLRKIELNSFTDYEIVVIDQSKTSQISDQLLNYLNHKSNICYIQSKKNGKSRGLNLAIKLVKGPIVAFTDDDCLPHKDWLINIYNGFINNPGVCGIFGKTLPFRLKRNTDFTCPATFSKRSDKLITVPCKHSDFIGYGNNMAFRKELFDEIGKFKEWLGPGSIGSNAEDAEFALRSLNAGKSLLYKKNVLIFHNNWLNKQEALWQTLSYITGEFSCYAFFAFSGYRFAIKIVIRSLSNFFRFECRYILSIIRHLKVHEFKNIFWISLKGICILKGIGVAFFFYLKDYNNNLNY